MDRPKRKRSSQNTKAKRARGDAVPSNDPVGVATSDLPDNAAPPVVPAPAAPLDSATIQAVVQQVLSQLRETDRPRVDDDCPSTSDVVPPRGTGTTAVVTEEAPVPVVLATAELSSLLMPAETTLDQDDKWKAFLVKAFASLMNEMTTETAVGMTNILLENKSISEDQYHIIKRCGFRRETVGNLLHCVLRGDQTTWAVFKSGLDIITEDITTAEKQEFLRLENLTFENGKRMHHQEPRLRLQECDVVTLTSNFLSNVTAIDKLNDGLLSKFHFSRQEHEAILNCDRDILYRADLFISTMEQCSDNIVEDVLSLLEDVGLDDVIGQLKHHVAKERHGPVQQEDIDTNSKWKCPALRRYLLRKLGFYLDHKTGLGWIELVPRDSEAWTNLEKSGEIENLVPLLYDNLPTHPLLQSSENRVVSLKIYIHDNHCKSRKFVSGRTAILDLIETTDEDTTTSRHGLLIDERHNPIEMHEELLLEGIELPSLIVDLKEEGLLGHISDIEAAGNRSRSKEMRHFLRRLSTTGRNLYNVLLLNVEKNDPAIFHEIVAREKLAAESREYFTAEVQATVMQGDLKRRRLQVNNPTFHFKLKLQDSLQLLYPELKDKLRRHQCKAIAKDITAGRPLTAEEKLSFQKMTKRRNLVDWVLKYVLNQKDEMVLKIFCESLCKHSPSLGQTLQETSVQKHELVKTERQPTTIQQDDLHFLQRRFNSKLVVDIIIDQLLSRFLITVEEHSSIQSSSYEAGMIKRLEALLQYDQEIMQQFKLITQSFRNASVAHTADWLVPLHALAKETLSCGKGLSIATYIFQKVPGIISPSDLDELYKLKDNSRDVIDRLLKHIYRHPRPEMFDIICYSLKDHDEKLYEHFLRMFFFKGGDKEKTKPVVNKDSAMPSGSGTDHLDNILWSKHTLDVVIDHLLSSCCITVDQHSDIRETGSIHYSIEKLVELLKRSPQMIMAVNAILRHLDKIADTTNTGNKEITIAVDFGDPEVNSQAKNYMDSRRGHTLTLAEIGRFYINDVEEGSVVIKIVPLDQESLIRFREMQKNGTLLGYLKNHVFKKFLPEDVEVVLSEPSIGVMEETTCVPVQSAHIINATIELSSVEVYKMENESFDQSTILQPDHHKCIGSIRMFANELLSQESKSNSPGRGLVFAGRLGSNGEPLAIKRMDLRSCNESLERYKTVKERLQHRNIIRIFCVEKDEDFGYVAMERMDENLDEYLTRLGQHGNADMSTEDDIYYMKRIVTGLAFIHEKGCLHNVFSGRAILLKRNNPDTHPKQVSIACFSDAALGEQVPVSCKKGTHDVLALIKVLLFVLNKKENIIVNGVIQPVNSIIQSGHFDIFVLLQRMLDSRLSDGLKLQEFVLHPALSNPIVQLDFLKESDRLREKLGVDFNLTNRTSVNVNNPWLNEPTLTSNVYQHLTRGRHGNYKPHSSLNSLVRCIRNCHQHLHTTIPQVQMDFGPEERYIYYWLVKFPGLVSSVYEAMRPHNNHTDLIRFFTIES